MGRVPVHWGDHARTIEPGERVEFALYACVFPDGPAGLSMDAAFGTRAAARAGAYRVCLSGACAGSTLV